MEDFILETENIAEKMLKIEAEKKELCKAIRNLQISKSVLEKENVLESNIAKLVIDSKIENIKIAGIDGGLISKSFHGFDLLVLRAVGVIFEYSDGKLSSTKYHPKPIVEPTPKVYYEPFYETEFETNSNIVRQNEEISRAKEVVEKFKPEIIFLHGSIVPQYTTVPGKDSLLYENFKKMINSYVELYNACIKNNVKLAGVVEDSRSSRFCSIIKTVIDEHKIDSTSFKNFLGKAKDSVVLNQLLGFKERSFVFGYSTAPENHPILKLLGNDAIQLADDLASKLVSLSKNSMYALPPMIVEADQRAKLSEDDFNLLYSSLLNKLGNISGLNDLRRSNRPF